EHEVEEEQELAPRRGLDRPGSLGWHSRLAGVDGEERDDRHLLALLLELEVGDGEARDGVAGLVDHEHGHGDERDVRLEDDRGLRLLLRLLRGNERHPECERERDEAARPEHEASRSRAYPRVRADASFLPTSKK